MKKFSFFAFTFVFMFCMITNVKANFVSNDALFVSHTLDSSFTIPSNGSVTGQISFHQTAGTSNNSGSFAYVDICTTGYAPNMWITGNTAGTMIPNTKVYKLNSPCYVNSYKGTNYRQILYINSSRYSPECSLSSSTDPVPCTYNQSTGRLFSNTDYTTYFRIMNFGISDSIPLDDLMLDEQITQTTILRDILSTLTSSTVEQTQAIKDQTQKIEQQIEKTEQINNTLNNSDINESSNTASNFFSGFTTDTFGLTSVITAPLNLIGSITSSTCSPLGLPLPYVNKTLTLPCLSSIYKEHFGSFLDIYQIITFGITAYWVLIRIFNLVKDFKNPDHDEIEVLDL